MKRRLLTTRRRVSLDRSGEYDALWSALRDAVVGAQGHAWRFRAATLEDVYLEFIESRELDAILALPGVTGARVALDEAFGTMDTEVWEEATTP